MSLHVFLAPVLVGMAMGLLTRVLLIQTSYRQFPSRPHGTIIQLFLSFVASLIGALIVPAVFKPDFTAGVFISIGTAQFHTMRDLERKAWQDIDCGEVVPRGEAYIDGIAAAFEARTFLVIGVAAVSTTIAYLFHWPYGLVAGVVLGIILRVWKQGKSVSDLADVTEAQLIFDAGGITVEGLRVASSQSDAQPATWSDQRANEKPSDRSPGEESSDCSPNAKLGGRSPCAESTSADTPQPIAIAVIPRNIGDVITFAHKGQQQAILHNLAIAVGVLPDSAVAPKVTYHPQHRKLFVILTPIVHDVQQAIKAVAGAPVLEGVERNTGG